MFLVSICEKHNIFYLVNYFYWTLYKISKDTRKQKIRV